MPSQTASPPPTPLAAAVLATLCACAPAGSGPAQPPLVLVVSVDTLRADALSNPLSGSPSPVSPRLDALAARGVYFERCFAQAPNTATSHASLFTGLLPWTHRVANFTSLEHGTPGLPAAFTTLAERLAQAGFETAAFTDDGPLGRSWNLMQGFDALFAEHEPVDRKVTSVIEFLDGRDAARPLFLFLHTYEVHQPYVAPREFADAWTSDYTGPLLERVEEVRAVRAAGERPNDGLALLRGLELDDADVTFLHGMYLAEVQFTDRELGRLFDALAERSLFDEALIAVTSDHGEEFREHGVLGHEQLYTETLHVPLILKLPGSAHAGTQVAARVNQFDLHPTLLELLGLPRPAGLEAVSLVPEWAAGARSTDRASYAETTEALYEPLTDRALLSSLRDSGHTLIERRESGGRAAPVPELFGGSSDPREERGLAGAALAADPRARASAAALAERVERRRADSAERRARLLGDAETSLMQSSDRSAIEALERLGYLDPGAGSKQ